MKCRLTLIILLAIFGSQFIKAQDVENSKDHVMLTRYPGSNIAYYEEQQYKPYKIAVGPVTAYRHIDEWVESEGKFTRIYYEIPGKVTVTEVYRNYMTALKKGGATILVSGINDVANRSKEIGGRSFLETCYAANPVPSGKGVRLLNGSATSGGSCYITAQIEKPDGKIYITIGGAQYSTDLKLFMVDIIEETTMEDDLIKMNADEMSSRIKNQGKVALYGLFFDFDEATLQAASTETMEQIALLLNAESQLKLYVVGHTDMQGLLDYNLKLSKQRAETVVRVLSEKYGISVDRLNPEGVGPLVPVSANTSENGRKLNRRVELVER